MKTLNYLVLILVSTCLMVFGCSDLFLEAEKGNSKFHPEIIDVADNNSANNGASVDHQTFTVLFPQEVLGVDFLPVPAPCLGLGEPLRMSGIWTGWFQVVTTPNGRLHITERIDYSKITLETDHLTWVAGPGANETIIQNVPLTRDDVGEAAFNVIHEFHASFISQDGASDLRVNHRVRQLLGPDGVLRKNEFVPFTASCIGSGK